MKRTTVPRRLKLKRTTVPKIKFCYYYLITNQITGKQYVGSRVAFKGDPEEDIEYMGSSKVLKVDYPTYGIENFTKTVLSHEIFIDKHTLCNRESYFIHEHNTLHPNGYNRYDPGKRVGFSNAGTHWSEETRQKMIVVMTGNKRCTGKPCAEETRQKISKYQKEHSSRRGRPVSDKTREKMSLTRTGLKLPPRSKEHCEKISIANKGRELSEETKRKIGLASTGRKHSKKTKQKLSELNKGKNNYWYGKYGASHPSFGTHPSEETRLKMRISRNKFIKNKRAQQAKEVPIPRIKLKRTKFNKQTL